MSRLAVAVLFVVALTGCSSFTRVHGVIDARIKTDAANALVIAEQSGDEPMERCANATLAAAEKAPKPEQITGILSKLAAKRAKEAILEELRRDCGEVYMDSRAALIRLGLLGLF